MDVQLRNRSFYRHNFGHNGPLDFHGLGINAKISELQGAMGLAVLPYMSTILSGRKKSVDYYNDHLDFSKVSRMKIREKTDWNYSYYPVIFKSENDLLKAEKNLADLSIIPRRYFYPSLNTLAYVKGQIMPISEEISRTILCLPLYHNLPEEASKLICEVINEL